MSAKTTSRTVESDESFVAALPFAPPIGTRYQRHLVIFSQSWEPMPQQQSTVFISYRGTSHWAAQALYEALAAKGCDVFLDTTNLGIGEFGKSLVDEIQRRSYFLVLLTPSALDNCNDPTDWLRHEIITALKSGRQIIPIFLDGFDLSNPEHANSLIGPLAPLKRYQGIRLAPADFQSAVKRLLKDFLTLTSQEPRTASAGHESYTRLTLVIDYVVDAVTKTAWDEIHRGLPALCVDGEHVHWTTDIVAGTKDARGEVFVGWSHLRDDWFFFEMIGYYRETVTVRTRVNTKRSKQLFWGVHGASDPMISAERSKLAGEVLLTLKQLGEGEELTFTVPVPFEQGQPVAHKSLNVQFGPQEHPTTVAKATLGRR